MEIQIKSSKLETEKCPAVVLFLPQETTNFGNTGIYAALTSRVYRQKDFAGKLEETIWLYPPEGGAERLLLTGIGEWSGKGPNENVARQNFQYAVSHAVQAARKLPIA